MYFYQNSNKIQTMLHDSSTKIYKNSAKSSPCKDVIFVYIIRFLFGF